MQKFKSVEEYISSHKEYLEELTLLRSILLATEFEETVKWSIPVYTINGKNVAGLGAFKSYVGIWFFQGVFLQDEKNKLVNAQEGKTKAMRQWRFSSIDEIDEDLIKAYLEEAIQNQKEGKEVKPSQKKPLQIPVELAETLAQNPTLNNTFNELSLSKKREFAEYIGEAKREATRISRLEKVIPMILGGIGLNDKYK